MQHVICHIIYCEDFITSMYSLIHKTPDVFSCRVVVFKVAELVELCVYARSELKMDFSLELKKTGLHAEKIITLRLFEIGVSVILPKDSH